MSVSDRKYGLEMAELRQEMRELQELYYRAVSEREDLREENQKLRNQLRGAQTTEELTERYRAWALGDWERLQTPPKAPIEFEVDNQ